MFGPFIQIYYEGSTKVYYDTNFNYIKTQEFYENDQLILKKEYYRHKSIMNETYYHNGLIHRDENIGPALIEYDLEQNIINQIYYKQGKKHRGNGPAQITIIYPLASDVGEYEMVENYYLEGKLIRYVSKNREGEIQYQNYYYNYVYHHLDYPSDGNQFYVFGKPVEKRELFCSKRIIRKGIRRHLSKKRNQLNETLDHTKIKIKDVNRLISKFVY